ncbi:MAG: hypothetical protein WCF65_06215 [Parachlamydiaceae bacterium]
MFRKRQRKHYPPGTFIPTPARVCAIIQLCLAFTIILWFASQPFVGEIFTLKSRLLFYQDLMGVPSHAGFSPERLARLERNSERFQQLPRGKQEQLKHEVKAIHDQFNRSFLSKLSEVIKIFAFDFSPYELLWLVLSIAIPIMLLKRVEGAAQAVWLLPLLVACYTLDNRMYGRQAGPLSDSLLFPTEQELVYGYIEGGLSRNVMEQQEQLINGWQRYLVINWGKDVPADDAGSFSKQVENAEFIFTLARLEIRSQEPTPLLKKDIQQPIALVAAYFLWNLFFAYTASKKDNKLFDQM